MIGNHKLISDTSLTATFTVPYEKGALRAIGIRDGKEMESKVLQTTGPFTRLILEPEMTTIDADRSEIAYIGLMAADDQGREVPVNDISVTVEISGEGELLAAGSASPTIQGSFTDPAVPLFRGRALIIVRSSGEPGNISIHAECKGLEAETTIQTL